MALAAVGTRGRRASYGGPVVAIGGHGAPPPRSADETYDDIVGRAAPWLALGLAVLHVCLTAINATFLTGSERLVAGTATATAAVVFAIASAVLRRWPPGPGMAHPVTASMVFAVVVVSVIQLVATEDPGQTSHVLLAVAGSGVALLSVRWLAAVLYLTWGAWGAGAVLVGGTDEWPRLVVAMTIATVLAATVNLLLRRVVRELAEVAAAAEASAVRDQLTGLSNRRGLAMVGTQITEHARRTGDAVHCIFVDVVGLDVLTERLGTEARDDVLCSAAEGLRLVTRSTDVVARWAGDGFCVVGPGPGMPPVELERRLRDAMLLDPAAPHDVWSPRVSAGGAMLAPWDSGTLDTLLSKADHEMFLRRALRREAPGPAPRPASAE